MTPVVSTGCQIVRWAARVRSGVRRGRRPFGLTVKLKTARRCSTSRCIGESYCPVEFDRRATIPTVDVCVVGFDDIRFARYSEPALESDRHQRQQSRRCGRYLVSSVTRPTGSVTAASRRTSSLPGRSFLGRRWVDPLRRSKSDYPSLLFCLETARSYSRWMLAIAAGNEVMWLSWGSLSTAGSSAKSSVMRTF